MCTMHTKHATESCTRMLTVHFKYTLYPEERTFSYRFGPKNNVNSSPKNRKITSHQLCFPD